MQLQVVTPSGEVVSDDVEEVYIPGIEGEFGVLAGHIPFLSTMRPGVLRYASTNGHRGLVAVAAGLAEVGGDDRVVVLAEQARNQRDINQQNVRAEHDELRQQVAAWEGPTVDHSEAAHRYRALCEKINWLEAQLSAAEAMSGRGQDTGR